jgi:N-glycosylase/DNA lyase
MKYRGYDIEEIDNGVVVSNIQDFNPVHVFECGQCFRWLKQKDGSYTGVANGRTINVSLCKDKLIILNTNLIEFINIWFEYFDMGRDYSSIKIKLGKDKIMKKAIEFGCGIRILKQDLWETLISFIISANNRIPMIMKVVDSLSRSYGEKIIFQGREYYTFPDAGKISSSDIEELAACRMGFRCKYVMGASLMVINKQVSLNELSYMHTDQAREELKRLPGVGNKVADCTLLYSGTKIDVFPTDVWVKRVMEELYFEREASLAEIQCFAKNKFGEISGIAQQYLFYYAREHKIGIRS